MNFLGMERKNEDIICKECGFETKINGLAYHFKSKHNMSIDEYVQKHGEYRPKYIDYNKRSEASQFKCLICGENLASERHLTYHIRGKHGISKSEYVLKYVFDNKHPVCACGCGQPTTLLNQFPYKREYLSGHNAHMHIGSTRSYETRMKQRESAINRIKNKKGVFFYNGVSKAENELYEFIKKNYSGEIIRGDKKILHGLELDIYLPELKLAIELNGEYFHSTLYKPKNYHLKKTTECNKQGISLVHIWMSDWIWKSNIVKSMLLSKMGKISQKIYGRKTEIREISNKDASLFLNETHLQGSSVSSIRIGLFYENELVQVGTFGRLRRATGRKHVEKSYELLRLSSKLNTTVIGGASKILSYFKKMYNPKMILSYAKRDHSMGNVYEQLGFIQTKTTPPGYFYSKGKRNYHRYKFQKHKLVESGFDKTKTESEIMTERGYVRVYDSGNYVYELHL